MNVYYKHLKFSIRIVLLHKLLYIIVIVLCYAKLIQYSNDEHTFLSFAF